MRKKARECRECGTPLFVGRELRWEDNGVISLARSPRNRMVLYESEIIDNLFKGIGELIGINIEHIVIESRRREVRKYIEGNFPAWMRKPLMYLNEKLGEKPVIKHLVTTIRERLGKVLARQVFDIGRVYGYGDVQLGRLWGSGDLHPWRINVMHDPHSVLFFAAEELASVEAFEGRDCWVRYEEIDEGVYEYTAYPSEHLLALEERLERTRYDFKPGDMSYERCPGCGIPMQVAAMQWNMEKGTIYDPQSGRRMALFGPFAMDTVLRDLESELGESIPHVAIEAQRRFVKSAAMDENWRREAVAFRDMIALRGLGNLTRFEGDREHLELRIENSCMHLLMVGTVQAMVEMAYGVENSDVEWSLCEDGDIDVTVRLEMGKP